MKKFLFLIPDGLGDYSLKELGKRTPLGKSKTEYMDILFANAYIKGSIYTIPDGMEPGSDVGNLGLLGYNPKTYYSGRGALEAVSMGIDIDGKFVYRCNLINEKKNLLNDYAAGHISTKESKEIFSFLNKKLSNDKIKFISGKSFRGLLLCEKDLNTIKTFPPHDFMGKPIQSLLPYGKNSNFLIGLILKSKELLTNHKININRAKKNQLPANMIWPWGGGKLKKIKKFKDKYNLKGAIISGVDLINGIGKWTGLDIIKVKGASGGFDSNFKNKIKAGIKALDKYDFVFLHAEAIDEAGHCGDLDLKIKMIEKFDKEIVKYAVEKLKNKENINIVLTSDHLTPVKLKCHKPGLVPFIVVNNIDINKKSKFIEQKLKRKKLGFSYKVIENILKYKI